MLHPFELNGGFDMGTAQPIRNDEELEAFRNYYLEQKTNYRNYALICLGVNSALRISDILKLKWNDVYDSRKKCFKKHIIVTEKKTGTDRCMYRYLCCIQCPDPESKVSGGCNLCRCQLLCRSDTRKA